MVLFQVSANFLINQLKNIFTQDTWHCSFMKSKSVHSPSQNLLKTSILTPFLLVFTAVEVCNITNKNRSPGNLAKYQYFYKIDLISFLHFGKNWRSPSQKVSKHPLFTTFSLFLKVSEVCNISNKCWFLHAIFQINTNLLITGRNINIFTQEALYPSLISKKKKKIWRSPSWTFFKTSTFYLIFTIFNSEWGL